MAAAVASTLACPTSAGPVALGRDVGQVHNVEIDESAAADANGGKLQGHLPADGPHADDRGFDVRQAILGHESSCRWKRFGSDGMAGLLLIE